MTPEHKQKIGAANHARFIQSQDKLMLARVVSLYVSGETCDEIALQTGKSVMTIYRWVKQSGTPMRKTGDKHRGREWSAARRVHNPAKPARDPAAPVGYDILIQRAIGNKSISTDGYVVVNLGRGKRKYEHILVAEKALGRTLDKGMVVHHVNTNRQDNTPTNLLICSTGYHLALHARMRRHPYWKQF